MSSLQKQTIPINFSQGLDLKTDPWQIPIGKFLALQNTVFAKNGLLKKRNGFGQLTTLPNTSSTFLTTFNGNLTAIGDTLFAYSQGQMTWVNKGTIQPLELQVLPLIRSSTNQSQADVAISTNGLVCTVYTDNVPVGGSNVPIHKFAVADSTTGQNIVSPTIIVPTSGTVSFGPRVFLLGNYFIIVFATLIGGSYHLQYITVSTANPKLITSAVDISTSYSAASTGTFNGVVGGGNLYLAWNAGAGGGINMTFIDPQLNQHNTANFPAHVATHISMTADTIISGEVIWVASYNSGSSTGYVFAVNFMLGTILAQTQIIASGSILNLAISAQDSLATVFYEVAHFYSYDGAIATNFINSVTINLSAVVGTPVTVLRGVGLASNSFIVDGTIYFVCAYSSPFQPTYFVSDYLGNVIAKLAYSNGGGYSIVGVPNPTVSGSTVYFPYLVKDLVEGVNKTQGIANAAGVYSQTGINLASITIGTSNIAIAEIGQNLHLSGGFLWMYDGYLPVEHYFHLWPDYVEATWSATGGAIHAQPDGLTNTNAYFYQVTYEWSDNQGNMQRSAPSIPVGVTTTGSGTVGSITINVPMLRLTYKTANPVKIVIYRWSVQNQNYYQVTSILVPQLNVTTVDSLTYVDTLADSSILGNNLIYTTGGVVENIAFPAVNALTLFDTRLWGIDAEDPNVLVTTKQVIEATPAEPNDQFNIYVSPSSSAQGNTGPMKCIAPMDDKMIMFKRDAIYYFNGAGPDNTGANNQYSQPTFITATVGSSNQNSIVVIPQGMMFQSDKGIWLLDRNLETSYIGAPVEDYNSFTVKSAVNVPGTNQVRFTLSNNITLMYDYFFNQWGTFNGIPAISSTVYQNLHTFINSFGQVYQESPGIYLDGSSPVLMSFTTGWINPAGLQGYQRAYRAYLLGQYYTPHALVVGVAYDYDSSVIQQPIIFPRNFNPAWGNEAEWGDPPEWGGVSQREQWQVNFQRQTCEAFQISFSERYDPSFKVPAGAGLTLSGINLVCGLKKGYPRNISAGNKIG